MNRPAEIGLEQGREIFVVPGNLMNPKYEGGNELLKNGAALVTKVQDILDGLAEITPPFSCISI